LDQTSVLNGNTILILAGALGLVGIVIGILALVLVELGLITPPVGMNVFVINAMAKDVPMSRTFLGVMPFFVAELFRVALLVAFPALSLWLPKVLAG